MKYNIYVIKQTISIHFKPPKIKIKQGFCKKQIKNKVSNSHTQLK